MTMTNTPRPLALIILDGWGHREEADGNAIKAAHTPVWDALWENSPHTLLSASGLDAGLPAEQMGNSEVGHSIMGAGRVIYQSFTRINKDIADGGFYNNPALCAAVDTAVQSGKKIHLLGLLSPGGVHSHAAHFHAMAELAAQRGAQSVFVHAFVDGRDTPPRSAKDTLHQMDEKLTTLGNGRIASVTGRYFAMDRDERWERVQQAYDVLTLAEADYTAVSAVAALENAYARGEDDEFVQATAICGDGETPVQIDDGDVVIWMNFRADRSRGLTRALVDDNFTGFKRKARPRLADIVTLTEYAADIDSHCAYPANTLPNVLGEYVSSLGKHQLRIAETEKYAHVTFFFNGGHESPYENEDRILVPSPKVATYDLQPEMSAPVITDKLVEAIASEKYDLIVCNYANGDMVGHTGNFEAAVQAVETVDHCLGQVIEALHKVGGECVITADHGNVEQMHDPISGQAHTAHTCEWVPCIYVNQREGSVGMQEGGLADIAPTLLDIMALEKPTEMTGQSLLRSD